MTTPVFRHLAVWIAGFILISLSGCLDKVPPVIAPSSSAIDASPDIPVPPGIANEIHALELLAGAPDGGLARVSEHGRKVKLPAGSVDGLAAALARAGQGGTVVLASGIHTESGTVTISKQVTIVGEPGAVLKSGVTPYGADYTIVPALHVKGASHVTIWGLAFVPSGPVGGTAILLENSRNDLIARNSFSEFQVGVLLHHGDDAMLWKNRIAASLAWTTGEIPESFGIVAMNGDGVRVVDNDISGGLFGAWECDKGGYSLNNRMHDNFIGIILCCVPEEAYYLPGGELVGSDFPGYKWLVRGDDASNNFNIGFLVIDGANNNLLVKNTGSNNALYDMELTTDSYRFGFLTPSSFENTVIVGKSAMKIKNCGVNNTIIGGTLVDNSADPCN